MTASERSPGEGEDVAWSDEVEHLIAAADVEAPLGAQIAEWLTAEPAGRVADIGCGPGAMTLALLARSPDAQVDAVDGEPMMLDAARRCLTAAGLDAQVEFRLGDLDSLELAEAAYDLVWVGSVVHHLPDQQSGVDRLAALLRPGGRLALGEGGLPLRCLPYDLGIGRPGLEARLSAAQAAWFNALRAAMPGAVRAPAGWTTLLGSAGLVAPVTGRSCLRCQRRSRTRRGRTCSPTSRRCKAGTESCPGSMTRTGRRCDGCPIATPPRTWRAETTPSC
ncbi:MAG: class I SAM-dependent methyltransferase [Euzebyaceae bacterium]|nr:class I SAM-dependent methyltransferase [Euzebyaceae bacterium]